MILPDTVLSAAVAVNPGLGDAYGMIMRLEEGKPPPESADGPAETHERAHEYCRVRLAVSAVIWSLSALVCCVSEFSCFTRVWLREPIGPFSAS